MNGIPVKKINSHPQNWISLINFVENRSKQKVRLPYCNLYAYAANNPVHYIDPIGMWINNEDGSFTAEEGDTLWGLQQETGIDWKTFDYQNSPESLQVGQTVNVIKSQGKNNYPTIDSTVDAVIHYFWSDGDPVNLGKNTINELKKSSEHRFNQNALRYGTAKSKKHEYCVDLTYGDGTYHVGRTNVRYDKYEGTKYRIVTYHAFVNDGFWDVDSIDSDGPGPKHEAPFGTPYYYIPYSWTEIYKK